MKKRYMMLLILIFIIAFSAQAFSQQDILQRVSCFNHTAVREDSAVGHIENTRFKIETIKIDSAETGEEMTALAVLPPQYDTAKRYPVLYLLHGGGNSSRDWLDRSNLLTEYQTLLEEGKIGEMIFIIPGSGADGTSYYADWRSDRGKRYETYFVRELLPRIDKTYSVIGEPECRGVSGISMGGFGAFRFALKYPDLFTSASSFAGLLNTSRLTLNRKSYGLFSLVWAPGFLIKGDTAKRFVQVFGHGIWNWNRENPLTMLKSALQKRPQTLHGQHFFMAAGTEDVFKADWQMADMAEVMEKNGLDYRAVLIKGAQHSYHVIDLEIRDALMFHWGIFNKRQSGEVPIRDSE